MPSDNLQQRQQEVLELDLQGQGFEGLDHVCQTAEPNTPLWGDLLFRRTVTLMTGDPGVMKTTFGYSLGIHLCRGNRFLGNYPEEPIKLMYLDFESAPSLIKSRRELIDPEGKKVEDFLVWHKPDYTLPELALAIERRAVEENYNILIIDNQTVAFNTHDENDNAEAGRQINLIRKLAHATNAGILLYHHPSKLLSAAVDGTGVTPGLNKASGAGTRGRLVDIAYNLNRTCEDGLVQLECCKDRLADMGGIVRYIRRAEGQFELLNEPPVGSVLMGKTIGRPELLARQKILDLLEEGAQLRRDEIVSRVCVNGISTRTADSALSYLKRTGRVLPVPHKYGHYILRKYREQAGYPASS